MNDATQFIQTVIREKTLKSYRLAVVERVYCDGTKRYGFFCCCRGGKWEGRVDGHSKQQCIRKLTRHVEVNGVLCY